VALSVETALELYAGDVPDAQRRGLSKLVVDCLPASWRAVHERGLDLPATVWLTALTRAIIMRKAVALQLDSKAFVEAVTRPGAAVQRISALAVEAQNTQLMKELVTQVRLFEELCDGAGTPETDGQAVSDVQSVHRVPSGSAAVHPRGRVRTRG
jgi:hypothetical protein